MSHKYEIINFDTCEVLETFNDLGLAQVEADLLNRNLAYGAHKYALCDAGGFPLDEWPCTLEGEHKRNKPAPVVESLDLPGRRFDWIPRRDIERFYCDARR